MRNQIIVICISMSIIVFGCSKTSDVEPPSVSSVTQIEYSTFNLRQTMTMTVSRDTVRYKLNIMDRLGSWSTKDTAIQNSSFFPTLLSTIYLKEFWNMEDILANTSGDSHSSITISALSEQPTLSTSVSTNNKMVKTYTGNFGEKMKTTQLKLDSMITLITKR